MSSITGLYVVVNQGTFNRCMQKQYNLNICPVTWQQNLVILAVTAKQPQIYADIH